MAPMWHLGVKSLCWMLHALVLMTEVIQTVSVEPDVRLSDGQSAWEGRVEVLHDGDWGTVCDDGWGMREAAVVCRSLGYPYVQTSLVSFGRGSGQILLDNLRCEGDEQTLWECPHSGWGVHSCIHYEDVGVICWESDIKVRLVNGNLPSEGRVEVSDGGDWGTVCDDYWDMRDAAVVCRSLGYQDVQTSHVSFGRGSGQILLDDLRCEGDEETLLECPHSGWGVHNCLHGEDVGVVCTGTTQIGGSLTSSSWRSLYVPTEVSDTTQTHQGALTSPNWSSLQVPTEVSALTECSSLRADAFGWVDKPGVCYFMTGQKLKWSSAVDFCKNEGWSLIDIENATENEMLAARYSSSQFYWVGQNDRETEGTWRYLSKDTPSDAGVFLNWDSAQLQPEGGDSQNCVAMLNSGLWHDAHCTDAFYVTCKKRIDNPPEHFAKPLVDSCSRRLSVARPRRFVFVSSDATCNPQDALAPSYQAKSRIQCARDCLSRHDCQGFGFVAAGKKDDCVLCSKVLDAKDLQFKAGSLFYNEAL